MNLHGALNRVRHTIKLLMLLWGLCEDEIVASLPSNPRHKIVFRQVRAAWSGRSSWPCFLTCMFPSKRESRKTLVYRSLSPFFWTTMPLIAEVLLAGLGQVASHASKYGSCAGEKETVYQGLRKYVCLHTCKLMHGLGSHKWCCWTSWRNSNG